MSAIMLAAGVGSRLKAITAERPKCMVLVQVPALHFRALTSEAARMQAWYYDHQGHLKARLSHARQAFRYEPGLAPLVFWWKSWLKYWLHQGLKSGAARAKTVPVDPPVAEEKTP